MAKVLVLGAYGLIGAACVRCLRAGGHDVTCLGRNRADAMQAFPDANWIMEDVTKMSADDWMRAVDGIDAVVNATGALQTGGGTNLEAIHEDAVRSLVDALRDRSIALVQISAAGVGEQASTEFFRTKAKGDAIVRNGAGPYYILRPGLVIGAAAYGGTALLRAAASLPWVSPTVFADSRIQTVALTDVADAVRACVEGRIQPGTEADLVEDSPNSLSEVFSAMRLWLGLGPAFAKPVVPRALLTATGKVADALARFGWRSPLRTTSLKALEDGITGDPIDWKQAGGTPCMPLQETLARLPATVQERWFARLWGLMPVAVICLSLFWFLSGSIALLQVTAASEVLTSRGYGLGSRR